MILSAAMKAFSLCRKKEEVDKKKQRWLLRKRPRGQPPLFCNWSTSLLPFLPRSSYPAVLGLWELVCKVFCSQLSLDQATSFVGFLLPWPVPTDRNRSGLLYKGAMARPKSSQGWPLGQPDPSTFRRTGLANWHLKVKLGNLISIQPVTKKDFKS
jgi:hypothetical protein